MIETVQTYVLMIVRNDWENKGRKVEVESKREMNARLSTYTKMPERIPLSARLSVHDDHIVADRNRIV